MPYKTDKIKIDDTKLDNRYKIQPEQHPEIIWKWKRGKSLRRLAKEYGVSPRLISFIVKPEDKARAKQLYKDRGGWKAYYDKEKHAKYMRKYRRRKHELFKDNIEDGGGK